jgi:hypothetical protein
MLAAEDGVVNLPSLGQPAMAPLRELLEDPAVSKAGHDLKREWLALRRAGVSLAGARDDAMLASFVLDPGKRSYALDAVCTEHLGRVVRAPADLARPGRDATPVADLPVGEAGRIAGHAAAASLELAELLLPRLAELGLDQLLEEIEIPLIGVLVDIGELIEERDPCCNGVLLLGLDAPEESLQTSFADAAKTSTCRGFAVGRSIFSSAATGWFRGVLDDEAAIVDMANRYRRLIEFWLTHRNAGRSGRNQAAG